jgi:hypothetical protein
VSIDTFWPRSGIGVVVPGTASDQSGSDGDGVVAESPEQRWRVGTDGGPSSRAADRTCKAEAFTRADAAECPIGVPARPQAKAVPV